MDSRSTLWEDRKSKSFNLRLMADNQDIILLNSISQQLNWQSFKILPGRHSRLQGCPMHILSSNHQAIAQSIPVYYLDRWCVLCHPSHCSNTASSVSVQTSPEVMEASYSWYMPTERQNILRDCKCQYSVRLHHLLASNSDTVTTTDQHEEKICAHWNVCFGPLHNSLQYYANDPNYSNFQDRQLDSVGIMGHHRDECGSK